MWHQGTSKMPHKRIQTLKVMNYVGLSLWIQNTNWQLLGAGMGRHCCMDVGIISIVQYRDVLELEKGSYTALRTYQCHWAIHSMMINVVLHKFYLQEFLLKINAEGWAWWYTPEFLAIRKETGGLMSIQGQPRLHNKLQATQEYIVRPCLKNVFLTNEKFRKLSPEDLIFRNCSLKPWRKKEII